MKHLTPKMLSEVRRALTTCWFAEYVVEHCLTKPGQWASAYEVEAHLDQLCEMGRLEVEAECVLANYGLSRSDAERLFNREETCRGR